MKLALVLAGGGAKGAYQAGCFKALQELGLHFDIVTGTSIGALNALLIVQKDYDALYKLWDEITINDILKDPINLDFSFDSMLLQTNLIKPFFKSFINEKGADISPLKNKIHSLYNDKKVFSSNIDFGFVTVKYPSLTPLEITKNDMHSFEPIEFALASASCFPAFPIHHINDQGYIDGGYYDNLPISLALKMHAKKIIAINLNQEIPHKHFIDRPYIKIISPSQDLGGFLDFNRQILNWRIQLGYLDTLKAFDKLMGYRYSFYKENLDIKIVNKFYWLIIQFEDQLNHSFINKTIFTSNTPLTDLIKDNCNNKLELNSYFISSIEIVMKYFNYQTDIIYNFNETCHELLSTFINNYYRDNDYLKKFAIKDILSSIKKLNSIDVICTFYYLIKENKKIEQSLINNIFLNEYLIALVLSCI